ncbi:hypothetical protein [Phycicoccus sp. SLBN-51]|uniref:hypothetical protein n=1 Tax=Phycicoccus sp. SLBN-51 TaxID=2768447 RepID=UPI001153D192|nr:hypothetical protein [Phycicoccus sp. SLBN-51]
MPPVSPDSGPAAIRVTTHPAPTDPDFVPAVPRNQPQDRAMGGTRHTESDDDSRVCRGAGFRVEAGPEVVC